MAYSSAALSLVAALVAALSLGVPACSPATNAPSTTPSASAVTPDSLPMTQLASAIVSGFSESAELTLRDNSALAEAWKSLHAGVPGNPAPAVDFGTQTVFLVALGQRNTGGYTVHIDRIVRTGDSTSVLYTVTSPGPGCMTSQMMSSPVVAVSTSRVTGAVRFERRDVVSAC